VSYSVDSLKAIEQGIRVLTKSPVLSLIAILTPPLGSASTQPFSRSAMPCF
jgi:hypothetical protein